MLNRGGPYCAAEEAILRRSVYDRTRRLVLGESPVIRIAATREAFLVPPS